MVVVGVMVRDVGRGMLRSLKKLSDLCVQLKIDFSEVARTRPYQKQTSVYLRRTVRAVPAGGNLIFQKSCVHGPH